jgi:hypothetical protein
MKRNAEAGRALRAGNAEIGKAESENEEGVSEGGGGREGGKCRGPFSAAAQTKVWGSSDMF